MDMENYLPEQFDTNAKLSYTVEELEEALQNHSTLEAKATKADKCFNLIVDLGNGITGIIDSSEFEYRFNGKPLKPAAVLSKVGRAVKFKVIDICKEAHNKVTCKLSRKASMKECYDNYVSKLSIGDVIKAKVTFSDSFGVFCDIGCGCPALIPLSSVCIARIEDPKEQLKEMSNIYAIVAKTDGHTVILSHRELLGTWDQEASNFKIGDTAIGRVHGIKEYGVFVELTPNLSGLAEIRPDVKAGDSVRVFVKNIQEDKMKIKLVINSVLTPEEGGYQTRFVYKLPEDMRVTKWVYNPKGCSRIIESVFK